MSIKDEAKIARKLIDVLDDLTDLIYDRYGEEFIELFMEDYCPDPSEQNVNTMPDVTPL